MDLNNVESGSCHDVTFIFARGSTEMGKYGMSALVVEGHKNRY